MSRVSVKDFMLWWGEMFLQDPLRGIAWQRSPWWQSRLAAHGDLSRAGSGAAGRDLSRAGSGAAGRELSRAGSGAAGRELSSPYRTAASLPRQAPFTLLQRAEILRLRFPAAAGEAARGVRAEVRSVGPSSPLQSLGPNSPQ